MRGTNKAKEMRRRASQRRATHKARRTELMLKAETRRAAVEAAKTKVSSKSSVKSTVKASKPKKR